jgi:hypothetical protein
VTYSGFSETNPVSRTGHCFLTTDSGQSWIDASGTDGNGPKGNLPDLPHKSVVFDTTTRPSAIIVANQGGVLRSEDSGATWRVFGVGLPLIDCTWLAIDNSVSPVVIKVATYGRSCFQFVRTNGPQLWAIANIAFDPAAIGQIRSLPVRLLNYGDANVTISGLGVVMDGDEAHARDPPFSWAEVLPVPPIVPGEERVLHVKFKPAAAKIVTASLQVTSNASPLSLRASGQGLASPKGARLAVDANLSFGQVDTGSSRTLPITISNPGTKDLMIQKFERSGGSVDFDIVDKPALPVPIPHGGQQTYTVQFKPTSNGPLQATFEVVTDASISSAVVQAQGSGSSSVSKWLIVGLVVLGAAVVAGGGILAYKAITGRYPWESQH